MTFIWPRMLLLLLLLLPLCAVLYWHAQRRRRNLIASAGAFGVLRNSRGMALGRRRHLLAMLSLLSLTLLLLALARPQMPLRLPSLEGTVMLAFDVSASMAAQDVEPSRMEAAKAAAKTFIETRPSTVRIGVLAFSEGGMIVQPPTNERSELDAAIDRLSPQSGTSLGQGMLAALNAILTDRPGVPLDVIDSDPENTAIPTPLPSGSFDDAVIVLITDGENMSAPDPLEAAERAADYGVRVHTVGIGSPGGATVEVDGVTLATRLDEPMLQAISELSGGTYYRVENGADMVTIYDSLAHELTVRSEETEITALVAGLGMVLMIFGGMLSLVWLGRLP